MVCEAVYGRDKLLDKISMASNEGESPLLSKTYDSEIGP